METLREKLESEHIVREEPAQWIDSATLMQNGRLILTDKHLVFLLNNAKKPAIIIGLDTINSITHECIVTDHNILSVNYLQYDAAMFSVINPNEWENLLNKSA